MPDIFDQVAAPPKQDIFDQVSIPQLNQYNPTFRQRISDDLGKIRRSPSVESIMGETPEEIQANPPAESASPVKVHGVSGLFESTKPLVEPYPDAKTALDGLHNWAAGIINSVASPAGLATIPLGAGKATPAIVNSALKIAFGTQGAKLGYDKAKDLVLNHAKNTGAANVEDVGDLLTGAAMTAPLAADAVGAVRPKPPQAAPEATAPVETPPVAPKPATAPPAPPVKPLATIGDVFDKLPEQQKVKIAEAVKPPEPTRPPAKPPTTEPPSSEQILSPKSAGSTTDTGIVGMGGAQYGEVASKGTRELGGISERAGKSREAAEMTTQPEPGAGEDAADSVKRGGDLVAKGVDPEKSIADFVQTKRFNRDDVAVARFRLYELEQATNRAEEQAGTDSDHFRQAKDAEAAWRARVKPMLTEWAASGHFMQGQTDIDTGSHVRLMAAAEDAKGEELTPQEQKRAKDISTSVRKARQEEDEATQKIIEATKDIDTRTPEEKRLQKEHEDYLNSTAEEDRLQRQYEDQADKAEADEKAAIAKQKAAEVREKAEEQALQAAYKTVREAAARNAAEESFERSESKKRQNRAEDVQGKAAETARRAANRTVRKAAADKAAAEAKKRLDDAKAATKAAEVERKKSEDLRKTIAQVHRRNAIHAARKATKDRILKANLPRYLWSKAHTYIQNGERNLNDIVNKLATDEGLPVSVVRTELARPRGLKRLTDEAFVKQQTSRRLHEAAKRWVFSQSESKVGNLIPGAARLLFGLKVFGHGTVAFGTHAPAVAFQPEFWKVYAQDFGKMYKMVFKPAFYEQQAQDLIRRKNYVVATRAGLVNDPFKVEDFNDPRMAQYFGKITGAGNRGYFALKLLRQDMFDQQWDRLPATTKTPEIAKAMADGINHATGVVKTPTGKYAGLVFFAPKLELSRGAWLIADPAKTVSIATNWKNATDAEKMFAINQVKEKAQVIATLFGLLAANQGILMATGSNQRVNMTDPMKSDYLKFKAAGMDYSFGNAMLNMARLPVRLWTIGHGDGGKLKNVIYPDESAYTVLGEFARTQESPLASIVTDLAFKDDYSHRPLPQIPGYGKPPPVPKRLRAEGIKPYTWPEFVGDQLMPIWAEEAATEVWRDGIGLSETQRKNMARALFVTAIMASTGGRASQDLTLKK